MDVHLIDGTYELFRHFYALPSRLDADGSEERPMTDLAGKYGELGFEAPSTDGEHLYFIWAEDIGDIWVMDVVTDESE